MSICPTLKHLCHAKNFINTFTISYYVRDWTPCQSNNFEVFLYICGFSNLPIVSKQLIDTSNGFTSEFCECSLPDNSLPMAGLWRKSKGQYCLHTRFHWCFWFNTRSFWWCSKPRGAGNFLLKYILKLSSMKLTA